MSSAEPSPSSLSEESISIVSGSGEGVGVDFERHQDPIRIYKNGHTGGKGITSVDKRGGI